VTPEDRKMSRDVDDDQVRGDVRPGGTEGGRRPTGVSPGEVEVGALGQGQR
jgi:hypothetical protein